MKIVTRKAIRLDIVEVGKWRVLVDKVIVYEGDAPGALNVYTALQAFARRVRRKARAQSFEKAAAICDLNAKVLLDRNAGTEASASAAVVGAVLKATSAMIREPAIQRLSMEELSKKMEHEQTNDKAQ